MKKTAESYLGGTIIQAVITVPTSFTCSPRKAIKDIGTVSGITVLRIIDGFTAATIAYGLHNYLFLSLTTVSMRSRPLLVIIILEVKILPDV